MTFLSLPRPFDIWNGHQLWVTNPAEVNQTGSSVPPVAGSPSFYAATLGCDGPAFASYGCMGVVHVFHEGIVPGGIYEIEFLSEFCSPESTEDFSLPLEISNSELGDVNHAHATVACERGTVAPERGRVEARRSSNRRDR